MDRITLEFKIESQVISAELFLPRATGPHPAILVCSPMFTVKSQVAEQYALALADQGVAAFIIDHRYFGGSEGEPRRYENYQHKIQDLRAACDFLSRQQGIDSNKIGLLGICLGSAYAAWTSFDNPVVKAVTYAGGYFPDQSYIRDQDPAHYQGQYVKGVLAKEHYETCQEVLNLTIADQHGEGFIQDQSLSEFYQASLKSGAIDSDEAAMMSLESLSDFNAHQITTRLIAPCLMLMSERALYPELTQRFYEELTCDKQQKRIQIDNLACLYQNQQTILEISRLASAHLVRQFSALH